MTILSLSLIHLLAVMSPGPGFALAFRNSLKCGVGNGVLTALGISLGDSFLFILSVTGASIIIAQKPELMKWLQVFGALYLGYLGVKALRVFFKHLSSRKIEQPQAVGNLAGHTLSGLECFRSGFGVTILNPKAIIYFISISSQFMAMSSKTGIRILYSVILISITFLWFSFVAILVGNSKTRNIVSKNQFMIEGVMGTVLIVFCLYVLISLR